MKKTCRGCGKEKTVEEFGLRKYNGKAYLKIYCRKCEAATCESRRNPDTAREHKRRYRQKRRLDPERRKNVVIKDCRKSDKKRGLNNDLDLSFVECELAKGCQYCGEDRTLQLGLDRIDNFKGHTKSNVICACEKCNYFRRNMPFEVFQRFAPILREVREEGLLEDWSPCPSKRAKK